MKNVLVHGPLVSASGYGVHSRQIFEYCLAQKDWRVFTQVLPWGITPWCVNSEVEKGLYGKIMSASVPLDQKFDISFQIQLPHEWDPTLANYNVGVTAGVETTRCSHEWSNQHRDKMNLLIVPSHFTRTSLERNASIGVKTPIEVLPEAYFEELTQEPTADPLIHLPTQKNILLVGTLTSDNPEADRKNLVESISWLLRAFHNRPDVGIIVKTSKGRDTTIDREMVRKTLQKLKNTTLSSVNSSKSAKLYMLHGSMTLEEMNNLYKSPKLAVFASATRGEGFGLPLLEAAVAGIPIVATDWSAHTEFLSGESFSRAAYDLAPIPPSRADGTIFIKDAMWANVRESNFVRRVKQSLDENEKLKFSAKSLSKKLLETHSLSNLCKEFEKIMSTHGV